MNNICFMRNKMGYTQPYVANAIGVSVQAYVRYERQGFPYADRINALAEVFNCSTDYLLGKTDELPVQEPSSDLSVDEQLILDKYRMLSDKNKVAQAKHMDYLLFMQESEQKIKIS